jgi:DNA-binding response OmpR family regulator
MASEDFVPLAGASDSSSVRLTARPILVADPDPYRREAHATTLRDSGFDVLTAGDEGRALAVAITARPAVIVARPDAASGMSIDVCRRFRAGHETRDIPVLVLTPFDDGYTREQIVRAGATAILTEPLKGPVLVRNVRRLITHIGRRRRVR